MSILWCGGEDIDFPNGAGLTTITTASHFRANYGRCALRPTAVTNLSKSAIFSGGGVTTVWLSFRAYLYYSQIVYGLYPIIGLGKSGTTSGIFVGSNSNVQKAAIIKDSSGSFTALASESGTSLPTTGTIFHGDLCITNYGTNSVISFYVNGTLIVSFEGDSSISGVADLDSVFLYWPSASPYTHYWNCSEMIVATTDTRNMALVTCAPNAAGDSSAWTGAYTDIDDIGIDDGDLMYDNTVGHQALVNLIGMPTGSFSILAAKIAARATKSSDSTPTHLNMGVKSGGTVDVSGNHALTEAWASYERLMLTNPVTGFPFTPTEIGALQLALESAT